MTILYAIIIWIAVSFIIGPFIGHYLRSRTP